MFPFSRKFCGGGVLNDSILLTRVSGEDEYLLPPHLQFSAQPPFGSERFLSTYANPHSVQSESPSPKIAATHRPPDGLFCPTFPQTFSTPLTTGADCDNISTVKTGGLVLQAEIELLVLTLYLIRLVPT